MKSELIGKLEALLFIYGEPLSYKKIAQLLNCQEKEVAPLHQELAKQLSERGSGLAVVADNQQLQLVTRPDFGQLLEAVVKDEFTEGLSPASLEALSIVAYAAPISRAELEYIRGVNSTFTLRTLMLRGLIERAPDPKRSNAFLYNPSFEFLKQIGIGQRKNLPEYEKYQKMIEVMRAPVQENDQPNPTQP